MSGGNGPRTGMPSISRGRDGGRDLRGFLNAQQPVLAGVRIQAGDEQILDLRTDPGQAPVQGAKEVQENARPDPAEGLRQGDMMAQERDLQAFRPERHDRPRIQGIQVLRMPSPGKPGQAPGCLRDGGGNDGVEDASSGPFDGFFERAKRAFPVLRGRPAADDVAWNRARIPEMEPRGQGNSIPLMDRGLEPDPRRFAFRLPNAPVPEHDEPGFRKEGRGGQRFEDDFRADPPGIPEADPDGGQGHFRFFVSSAAGSGASPSL